MTQSTSEVLKAALEPLASQGWAVVETPELESLSLKLYETALVQKNLMRPAQIGRGNDLQRLDTVRTDSIDWQDFEPDSRPYQFLSLLRNHLNEAFYLGLKEWECHFAHYLPDGHYDWHIDQSRTHGNFERVITFVLYLNPEWQSNWGGELEIVEVSPILPKAGKLVLFNSQSIQHRVKPCHHDRWSLTGWFLRSSL